MDVKATAEHGDDPTYSQVLSEFSPSIEKKEKKPSKKKSPKSKRRDRGGSATPPSSSSPRDSTWTPPKTSEIGNNDKDQVEGKSGHVPELGKQAGDESQISASQRKASKLMSFPFELQLQAQGDEIANLRAELAHKEHAASVSRQENEKLKQTVSQLKERLSELEKKSDRGKVTETRLMKELRHKVLEAENLQKQWKAGVESVRTTADSTATELRQANDLLKAKEKDNARLRRLLEQKEGDLATANARLADRSTQLSLAQTAIHNQEGIIAKLTHGGGHDRYLKAEEECVILQNEMLAQSNQIESLQETLDGTRQLALESKLKWESTAQELTRERSASIEKSSIISSLEAETTRISILESQVRSLTSELGEAKALAASQEDVLSTVKSQLVEVQTAYNEAVERSKAKKAVEDAAIAAAASETSDKGDVADDDHQSQPTSGDKVGTTNTSSEGGSKSPKRKKKGAKGKSGGSSNSSPLPSPSSNPSEREATTTMELTITAQDKSNKIMHAFAQESEQIPSPNWVRGTHPISPREPFLEQAKLISALQKQVGDLQRSSSTNHSKISQLEGELKNSKAAEETMQQKFEVAVKDLRNKQVSFKEVRTKHEEEVQTLKEIILNGNLERQRMKEQIRQLEVDSEIAIERVTQSFQKEVVELESELLERDGEIVKLRDVDIVKLNRVIEQLQSKERRGGAKGFGHDADAKKGADASIRSGAASSVSSSSSSSPTSPSSSARTKRSIIKTHVTRQPFGISGASSSRQSKSNITKPLLGPAPSTPQTSLSPSPSASYVSDRTPPQREKSPPSPYNSWLQMAQAKRDQNLTVGNKHLTPSHAWK